MSLLDNLASAVRTSLEQRRMDLDLLASKAQIPRSKIDALLAARPSVTSRELTRIAEALDLDPHALQRGIREPLRSPAVFLKHSSTFQDFRHDTDGKLLPWVLDRGIALAALHPQGNIRRRSFKSTPIGDERPAHQGQRLASEVRSRLALHGAIQDMRALLEERLAIATYVRRLDTDAPAIAVCSHHKTAASVLINARRSSPPDSPGCRMTLAHELCHILFDPPEDGLQLVIENGANNDFEQRANAFAAEFLCPLAEMRRLCPALRAEKTAILEAAEKIADHFRINLIPALRQLQNRLDAPDEIVERLLQELPPLDSSFPPSSEDSPELLRRVREGWQSAHYSSSQARAFLGLSASDELLWPDE